MSCRAACEAYVCSKLIWEVRMLQRERVTNGGAVIISECVAERKVGLHVWRVWRERNAGVSIGRYIELDVGGVTYREGKTQVVDCPLEFFDLAPVVDRDWRDRVFQFHEMELEKKYG